MQDAHHNFFFYFTKKKKFTILIPKKTVYEMHDKIFRSNTKPRKNNNQYGPYELHNKFWNKWIDYNL